MPLRSTLRGKNWLERRMTMQSFQTWRNTHSTSSTGHEWTPPDIDHRARVAAARPASAEDGDRRRARPKVVRAIPRWRAQPSEVCPSPPSRACTAPPPPLLRVDRAPHRAALRFSNLAFARSNPGSRRSNLGWSASNLGLNLGLSLKPGFETQLGSSDQAGESSPTPLPRDQGRGPEPLVSASPQRGLHLGREIAKPRFQP